MRKKSRRRLILTSALIALGVYILLPTPDELLVHPAVAGLLFLVSRLPLEAGLMISFFLYRAVGVGALMAAILISRDSWHKIKQAFKRSVNAG